MENETKVTEKMSLAIALKKKERIARKLKRAREMLAQVNSVVKGTKRSIDATEAFETVQSLQKQFLEFKKAIAVANAGISAQLTEMLVVRAEKEYYERLDCKESESSGEWDIAADGRRIRVVTQYDVYINAEKREEIVEALERRLDELQDEVDAFNATHSLEIVA